MSDYIPTNEGEFLTWVSNFVTVADTDASSLGLTSAQLTELTALNTTWQSARTNKISAKTTYDGTVAAESSAQVALVADVRNLVAIIQMNPTMTDELRRELGITVPKGGRTPVGVPTTYPLLSVSVTGHMMHSIAFADSDTPTSKAKPAGVRACELREVVVAAGGTAPIDPNAMPFLAYDTRAPYIAGHLPGDAGKTAYYVGRWSNTKGIPGPWGPISSLTIAG